MFGAIEKATASLPPPTTTRSRQSSFSASKLRITTRRLPYLIVIVCAIGLLLIRLATTFWPTSQHYASHAYTWGSHNTSSIPFPPLEDTLYRTPDVLDTFVDYKYRTACNISSLDLHLPFSPLCETRDAMLTAMSSGGRIGQDAPYIPRGCDMRWFTTEEICEILSRFGKVIFAGDSMMRHVIGSINVLIRKNLGYGAVTDWNFSDEERRDCFCNDQFNVKACSIQGIFKTADVVANDPDSLACAPGTIDVLIEEMVRFPIDEEELKRYKEALGITKSKKPLAFVFGHGLWNDLDLQATLNWLDKVVAETTAQLPHLGRPTSFFPRLIITPNAAGKKKPVEWRETQGNEALMNFEESVKVEATRRGVEHLGTWNMSIQSNKFDGVHLDLKGNMIKAMMVLNWLNMLDISQY